MPTHNLTITSVSNWPVFPAPGDEVDDRFL
jgi:hypothetical protein